MVQVAQDLALPGKVSITLPKSEKSVFSISNHTIDLAQQQVSSFRSIFWASHYFTQLVRCGYSHS